MLFNCPLFFPKLKKMWGETVKKREEVGKDIWKTNVKEYLTVLILADKLNE